MRLASQSGVYALGNLGVKASGLLLAVYYLDPEYLAPAEYGRLALLDALARFAFLVGGLGLPTGLIRFAARASDQSDRRSWAATAWVICAVLAIALALCTWTVSAPLAGWLLGDARRTGPIVLLGAYIALKVVGEVPMAYLRLNERAGWFVAATVAEAVGLVVGVAVFVGVWQQGLMGVLYAYVLSGAVLAIPLSLAMLAQVGLSVRADVGRKLVVFGAPLVLAALSSRFLNLGDRFILSAMRGPELVALYDWASKLSGLINMLFVQGFQLSFTVIGLKAAGLGSELYRSAFRHFTVVAGWAVLGMSLVAVDLTRLVAADDLYLQIEALVLPIGLGFLFYGLYFVAVTTLFAVGDTKRVAWTVFAASALNAGLNVALIPGLGALGAAVATLGAYYFLARATAFSARRAAQQRGADMELPWRVAYVTCAVVLVLWGVGTLSSDWSVWPRLGARSLLILAYVPAVFACGLYSRDDWQRGVRWVREMLRR